MKDILLVDNDRDLLDLLAFGLTEEGYSVDTAESGLEALKQLERETYRALITDLIMPDIDGERLLRIVHAKAELQEMRTVVISGVAAEAPDLRQRLNCDVYIAKSPLKSIVKYIRDTMEYFEKMRAMSATSAIGIGEIYSRHITRELLDYKQDANLVLDRMADGICKCNGAAVIVSVNRAFCTIMGRREEELLGHPLSSCLTEHSFRAYAAVTTDEWCADPTAYIDLRTPDDRVLRVRGVVRSQGTDPFVITIWSDVTERLLSEEQFENIVESSNDVIWTHDFEGRFTYVSRSVQRITGWGVEEVIGRPVWIFLSERDSGRRERRFRKMISTIQHMPPDTSWSIELKYLCRDGSTRWGNVRSAPLRDHAGRTIGIRGVMADVTELRNSEREQQRLLENQNELLHELHHRVRDNLQIITSLAQISSPEHLETRLAAMGEVFNALYLADTYAAVPLRSVIGHVVEETLTANGPVVSVTRSVTVSREEINLRSAVPVTLLVAEAVAVSIGGFDASKGMEVQVRIDAEDDGISELNIDVHGARNGGAQGVPDDSIALIDILIDQLGGTYKRYRDDSSARFSATFSVEPVRPA